LTSRSKKIFITGASGFIGRQLCRRLLAGGHQVEVLIRPGQAHDARILEGCTQHSVALNDRKGLSQILAGFDQVIYCAGSVRGRKPEDFKAANIEGLEAILSAIKQQPRPPALLLISSLAASRPHVSDYAMSKFQGEQLLQAEPKLDWSIIRPPAVYGPGDTEMLPILKMAKTGWLLHAGPSEQRVSLIHVDDLAEAVCACITAAPACRHKIFALDDGKTGGYSWPELGRCVSGRECHLLKLPVFLLRSAAVTNLGFSHLFGYAPMLTPGKVQELIQPDWLGDNSDFIAATGWQPQIDLANGAARLLAKNK